MRNVDNFGEFFISVYICGQNFFTDLNIRYRLEFALKEKIKKMITVMTVAAKGNQYIRTERQRER